MRISHSTRPRVKSGHFGKTSSVVTFPADNYIYLHARFAHNVKLFYSKSVATMKCIQISCEILLNERQKREHSTKKEQESTEQESTSIPPLQVWNLELLMCAQTLVRHEGSVTCLLASGGYIFSGAIDNMIKVFTFFLLSSSYKY